MSNSLRKPRVFVSSTMQDLRRHRETAIKQLKSSDCIVDAMEDWTATNKSPVEYSTDRAKESDLLILLVGSRMGHKPSGLDKSITRLEYEAALSNDCAIHVYLLEDQYLGADIKEDPDFADLMQFREMLKESFTVGWFNPEHTSIDVTPALVRWLLENIALQPAVTYLPRARNPNFIGREQFFSTLIEFASTREGERFQVLVGLGGVGKSQLALEFAYEFRDRYATVWWINAETRAEQLRGLQDLALALDLPGAKEGDTQTQARAAVRWLNSHPGWLLILDNATDAKSVSDLLPCSSHGHVIITSRNPNWSSVGEVVDIPTLSRANAIEFLLGNSTQSDEMIADLVATELGDLPLALEQARAYMESRNLEMKTYLNLYRKHGKQIREIDESPYYPASIATTWSMAIDEISQSNPIARTLLECMSLLSSNAVYLDLFSRQTPEAKKNAYDVKLFDISELAGLALQWDEFELIEACSAIRRYALANGTNEFLTMHRMVQAVISDSIEKDKEIQLLRNLICRLETPPEGYFDTELDIRLSNHNAHAWELVIKCVKLDLKGKEICRLFHHYARQEIEDIGGKSSIRLARALSKKNNQMAIDCYGKDSPEAAVTLGLWSYASAKSGNMKEALDGYEELESCIEAIQAKSPMVAAECLAITSDDMSRVEMRPRAQSFASRSLEIARSNLSEDDSGLCYYLFVYGKAYLEDDPEKAASILQEGISLGSRLEGEDHITVLTNTGLLGDVMCQLGKIDQAIELRKKALEGRIKKYGEESSAIAFDLYRLMHIYQLAERFEDAAQVGKRAAEILEKSSGAPDKLSDVWFGLSKVCRSLQEYDEAIKYVDLAIDMTTHSLGNDPVLMLYYDYLADYASHLSWYEVLNEAIAGMRRVLDESNIADKDYWYVKAMYWQLYSNFWEHKFEEAQVDCVSALELALKLEQKSHVRMLVKDIAFWERLIHEQVIERDSISGIHRSEMISTLRQKHSAILDSAELDSVDERVNSWIGRKTCTDEG